MNRINFIMQKQSQIIEELKMQSWLYDEESKSYKQITKDIKIVANWDPIHDENKINKLYDRI